MHICVSDLTSIGSDNGLSPGRRQAIIRINAGILLIRPLGTNFSEFLVEIITFSFKNMRLKVSSAKRRPFCLGLNELTGSDQHQTEPRNRVEWTLSNILDESSRCHWSKVIDAIDDWLITETRSPFDLRVFVWNTNSRQIRFHASHYLSDRSKYLNMTRQHIWGDPNFDFRWKQNQVSIIWKLDSEINSSLPVWVETGIHYNLWTQNLNRTHLSRSL